MKIFLLDDDKTITNILKIIIQTRGLGEVCGICNHAPEALEDIRYTNPDIIIADLLMPEMDGITFVKRAKTLLTQTAFIMLSQVSSKDMIASAYEAGIEFYIQKPINSIEVETVIKNVCQSLSMHRTMQKMQSIFQDSMSNSSQNLPSSPAVTDYLPRLQRILQQLGIVGDTGCKDIITIIDYLIKSGQALEDITLNELCSHFTDAPKSMETKYLPNIPTHFITLSRFERRWILYGENLTNTVM